MEKLGQLVAANEWDLIVVDTPPSRSALDFLDAPNRLGRFLDGRMIRVLTAPARAGGKAYLKVVTVSVGVLAKVFTKVLGGDLLSDLSSFVSALESMFGGFRERAQHTYELLKTPGHGVRRRRGAGAGRAARGVLLRGAALVGADAARRPGREPDPRDLTAAGHQPAGRAGRSRGRRAGRQAGRSGDPAGRGCAAGARRAGGARPSTTPGWRAGSPPPTHGCRWCACPPCRPTCTTWTGCAASGSCWARPEPQIGALRYCPYP